METTSNGDANDLCVHRVFPPSLDAKKTWYALNFSLCCGRSSMFGSTESAKLFCDEYISTYIVMRYSEKLELQHP